MALNFPNQSRSYDASKHRIRFWAHDASLEICFFVEEEALRVVNAGESPSEEAILEAFDQRRGQILKAATRIYARHSKGSYTLTIADLG
jgi:hypothetical protein